MKVINPPAKKAHPCVLGGELEYVQENGIHGMIFPPQAVSQIKPKLMMELLNHLNDYFADVVKEDLDDEEIGQLFKDVNEVLRHLSNNSRD